MTNTRIEYRPITGHPGYRVGADGSVWSCWKKIGLGGRRGTVQVQGDVWVPLRPSIRSGGYSSVSLRHKGGRGKDGARSYRVHILVLTAFVGPCPDGMEACHRNDIPTDNRLENLRWDTVAANRQDGKRNGGIRRGAVKRAKITPEQAAAIRSAASPADRNQLADTFGVSKSHAASIARGTFWRGQDCGENEGCG